MIVRDHLSAFATTTSTDIDVITGLATHIMRALIFISKIGSNKLLRAHRL